MATILDGTSGMDVLNMGGGQGGILSGLILGALLGNNRGGLLGGGGGVAESRPVTVTDLNAAALGDIKASIPFNEAQVQLALSNAVSTLMANSNQNASTIHTGQTAAALQSSNDTAAITAAVNAVDTNVDRQAMALQTAIHADGEATRALITANTLAELNQRLTVAQLEAVENRAVNREQSNSHNVTMTMNNNQNQLQMQQQQQGFLLNQLVAGLGQLAHATNSSVVVGSSNVRGTQAANPTNVTA